MADINVNAIKENLADTFPKVLIENYKKYGDRKVAMRKKNYGIWNEYTWASCYKMVKDFALGLKALGINRGDKVCIIGDNDPEWFCAELAVQSIGGAAIGLYIDAIPSELEYLLNHSESIFVIAKDQEQVDKFIEIQHKTPKLRKVIYWDDKGMWAYKNNPLLMFHADVMELGRSYEQGNPDFFLQSILEGKGSDVAVLCYTSGTTGLPKGAVLTYEYFFNSIIAGDYLNPMYDTDDWVSFIPPAWIAEQLGGIAGCVINRFIVNFPEKPDTVQENIKEISPQCVAFGPRQWQSFFLMARMKLSDSSWIKRFIYNLCIPIGYKIADFNMAGIRRPPVFWNILHKIAYWICFRPINDYFGIRRLRMGMTGGAAIGPDIFHWFRALGVEIKEAYGLTEAMYATGHTKVVKVGTVGPPIPNCQVRISNEGEIIIKSDRMFSGYYNQPEETARTIFNGWVRTGDAGLFDEEGHLIVLDRVKDMIELRGGEKYSPSYIENRLKFSSYIKDVMAIGGEGKDFVFVIINMDFDNVGRWAEKNRIPYTTFVDLSQRREVADLILKDVQRINKVLPEKARIGKFALLPKEFDADEGELTRTKKLKRSVMSEKHIDLIDAAYAGLDKVAATTEVKYRDGRTGKTITAINIRTVGMGE